MGPAINLVTGLVNILATIPGTQTLASRRVGGHGIDTGCDGCRFRNCRSRGRASDLRLPGHLDEMIAERMRRELRLGIAEGGFALAAAGDQLQVRTAEQIRERHAATRTLRLHKYPTALECQIAWVDSYRSVRPFAPTNQET